MGVIDHPEVGEPQPAILLRAYNRRLICDVGKVGPADYNLGEETRGPRARQLMQIASHSGIRGAS